MGESKNQHNLILNSYEYKKQEKQGNRYNGSTTAKKPKTTARGGARLSLEEQRFNKKKL